MLQNSACWCEDQGPAASQHSGSAASSPVKTTNMGYLVWLASATAAAEVWLRSLQYIWPAFPDAEAAVASPARTEGKHRLGQRTVKPLRFKDDSVGV